MRLRLATRLALSHLLVVLVGFGLAGVGLATQTQRYFVSADREALQVQARLAADTCNDLCLDRGIGSPVNIAAEQLPAANNVTQSQANSPANLNVTLNNEKQVSASLANTVKVYRVGADVPLADQLVSRSFAGAEATGATGSALIAAAPIRRGNVIVGAVIVRGTLRNVNTVLRDLRSLFLGTMAIGSIAAVLFGVWRARSIAKPIRELTIATRGVAEGNFDQSIPMRGETEEISELTQTFDTMRSRIQRELATRSAFVADASHELRTPLTAIRGSVEILQSGGMERPEVRERFLGSLGRETDRLLELIDRLLDLQSSEQSTDMQCVDVPTLAKDVVSDLQVIAEHSAVRLVTAELHRPGDPGDPGKGAHVLGDESRLRQVLINLIQNAINASLPNGEIVVRTRTITGTVIVEVVDNGHGIPEADRERVFERFVRLDTSRVRVQNASAQPQSQSQLQAQSQSQAQSQLSNRALGESTSHNTSATNNSPTGGTGLGLAIARLITESHGGTLTLHANTPQGTIARLALPIAP